MAPGSWSNYNANTQSVYAPNGKQIPYEVISRLPSHYSEWIVYHIRYEYTVTIYEMQNVYSGKIFCIPIHMSCDAAPYAHEVSINQYGISVYDTIKRDQARIDEKAKKLKEQEEKRKEVAERELRLKQEREHKKRQFRKVYWNRKSKEKTL